MAVIHCAPIVIEPGRSSCRERPKKPGAAVKLRLDAHRLSVVSPIREEDVAR